MLPRHHRMPDLEPGIVHCDRSNECPSIWPTVGGERVSLVLSGRQ